MNKKFFANILTFCLILISLGCAIHRHSVKENVKDEDLVLILPLFLDILTIDNESLDNKGRRFLITPGNHIFKVMFSSGRIRSTAYKEVSINGNPGETYALCSYADIETNAMGTIIERNGKWIAFFAIVPKEELETYRLGLGYDSLKLHNQICIKEINTKNLLN
ncbi:hypothetical protein NUH30_19385 [Leptospira sp. 85282-16]|uniref:hypothetical protein n=1 Tax=Leptospira sp. 85282-16 TaxID=2971256 RepID=UPI0021BEBE11|nr:hypothetical protein [Leptospira sp. 85282-16]MCT8335859.1 hypothetical protein [Leptospira sp. 85282-16]